MQSSSASEVKYILNAAFRIVKRYDYSKSIMFFDVVCCESTCLQLPWLLNRPNFGQLFFFSLIVKGKCNDDALPEIWREGIFSGDVIEIEGCITDERCLKDVDERFERLPVIVISGELIPKVKVRYTWDKAVDDLFYFYPDKLMAKEKLTYTIDIPALVIQTQKTSTNKILAYLREAYSAYEFRETISMFGKCQDHLISVFPRSSDTFSLTMKSLLSNNILSQAITRLYAGSAESILYAHHVHLPYALDKVANLIVVLQLKQEIDGVRLQAYPRSTATKVMDILNKQEKPLFRFSPTKFTHILSAVFLDGCWFLSLITKEQLPIEDIYEAHHVFGGMDRICKSMNKLHEGMTRMHWIHDTEASTATAIAGSDTLPRYPYRFAIDIGASPGSWSAYLAQHLQVANVLSMDKGELKIDPLPANITYWQIAGQDGIERLQQIVHGSASSSAAEHSSTIEENNLLRAKFACGIDLFCCDANIPPEDVLTMFETAVHYGLVAQSARVLITLKNTFRRKSDFEASKVSCLERLKRSCRDVKIIDLLANTPNETTIAGTYPL